MLDRDRGERGEGVRRGRASARTDTDAGVPAPSPPGQRARLVPDRSWAHPSRPRSCTRPARRTATRSASGKPIRRAGRTSQIGHRPGVAECVRRLEVDKSAIASSAASNSGSVITRARVGSASITCAHWLGPSRPESTLARVGAEQLDKRRVELRADRFQPPGRQHSPHPLRNKP